MNYDISHPFPITAPIPAQASFTDKNRLSLLRSSDDEPISDSDIHQTHHHYHLHHHSQLNQTVSEKGKLFLKLFEIISYKRGQLRKPIKPLSCHAII